MSTKKLILSFAIIVVVSCFGISHGGTNNSIAGYDTFERNSELIPIELSPKMLKTSPFEPSGICWINELNRYLIVSDDTGTKKLKNIPLLFSVNTQGKVDDQLVNIKGINRINDLESITRDDKGFIYLLSSQVSGKKGKRKKSRELFVKTRLNGHNVDVVSYVHLLQLLKNAVAEKVIVPSDLGIDDDNFAELNIEGICFFQDKIYLGLESPLDDEGRSLIWVLENPSDLFNTKRLNSSSVRLWAKVRLSSFGKKRSMELGIWCF